MTRADLERENRRLRQQVVTLEAALAERERDYDPLTESALVKQAVRVAILRGRAAA